MQLERVRSDGQSPLASLLVLRLPGSLWTWTFLGHVIGLSVNLPTTQSPSSPSPTPSTPLTLRFTVNVEY
ncbi:hypothetical protein ACLKA6_010901 [Drosophila palustris]